MGEQGNPGRRSGIEGLIQIDHAEREYDHESGRNGCNLRAGDGRDDGESLFERTGAVENLESKIEHYLKFVGAARGIYVAMHGNVFAVQRVRKDNKLRRFVWADEPVK